MAVTVKREDGKVWIEGVPTLGWGKGRECTCCGALEAATAVTARPFGYDDLMGWSALAFRVRWYQGDTGQRWCPSSPVGEFPEEFAALQKATGWELRGLMGAEGTPHMERHAPEIVASINAGLPVPACEPRLNMDVVYGYEDGGNTLLMHDYFRGDEPLRLPASDLGFMAILLGKQSAPLSQRDALVAGLRAAVFNWRRGKVAWSRGGYWYGDAGYAHWSEDLGKVGNLTEEERALLFFVSHWNYCSLEDARRAAARFLKARVPLLGGKARAALERAAALYRKEGELLARPFGAKDAFLGQWSGKTITEWAAAVRKHEQEILSRARALEGQAVSQIEAALEAEGVEVPATAGGDR